MRRENVEALRRAYDAFARGDFGASLDLFDPYVVFVQLDDADILVREISGVYWGIEGLQEYMRKLLAPWARLTIELREMTEVGDSVVAEITMRVVGREAGAPGSGEYCQVWTFRGDRVVRLEVVRHRERALRAVGSA